MAADRSDGHALARARTLIDTPPDVNTPSRLPKAARLFRRSVNRALANHTEQLNFRLNALADALQEQDGRLADAAPQQGLTDLLADHGRRIETEESILSEIRAKSAALRDEFGRLRSDVTDSRDQAYVRLGSLETTYGELMTHLAKLEESIRNAHDAIGARLDDLQRSTNQLNSENVARPYMSNEAALRTTGPDGGTALGYDSASLPADASYADFEDLFRGTEDMITERLRPYLGVLAEQEPVLDIGCGRGELLTLLSSNGITARGIDPDASMIARAQQRGLDVDQLDAAQALAKAEAGSLGAVISIQVVEHISPAEMREMFKQSFEALRPGGVFIAETVNPHSPMALKAFWVDLTHVRPLYPESLLLLTREAGFDSAYILFPVGTGDLDQDLRNCGEYAIVARKV